MSTVRVRMRRWGGRTRGAGVRVEVRQALVVLAVVVAVFAGFFALGRVTRNNSETSRAYGPQELPAVSVRADVPDGLPAAAPIPFLLTTEAPPPQASKSSARAVAGSSSGTLETSSSAAGESRPVQSASPTPVQAAPVQAAPVQSAPAPVSRPRAAPQHSEGGSFDSSG
jgi:hypothetical protein